MAKVSKKKLKTLSGDTVTVDIVDEMYVDGRFVSTDETIPSVHPPTGEQLASIPVAMESHVDDAVAAAKAASDAWQDQSLHDRRETMDRFADLIESHSEAVAMLDVTDNGSVLDHFRNEVSDAVEFIRHMSGLATRLSGDVHDMEAGMLDYEIREPYGAVGSIVPFNHPAMLSLEKVASVLMAGNGLVLKPDERTSLSALYIAKLIDDADLFPDGLVNVVSGGGDIGGYLSSHPDVGVVTFTGSVQTGRKVMHAAAENFAEVHLELGGKNPSIVFPDADIKAAAAGTTDGMNLTIGGQSCAASTFALVHEDVYEPYLTAIEENFSAIDAGDPLEEGTAMGSLISDNQLTTVHEYVQSAVENGATVVTGGSPSPAFESGHYFEPTVLEVDPTMRVAREEIFGPVLVMTSWSDYDHMIRTVNDLDYGLTGSIWTSDLDTAHRTAERVESGYIWINQHGDLYTGTPFGGFKNSGIGSNGVLDELRMYTRVKNVNVALDDRT